MAFLPQKIRVLIPLNSGLVFTGQLWPHPPPSHRLNPFEFRAGIYWAIRFYALNQLVLIPLNSGLVFTGTALENIVLAMS